MKRSLLLSLLFIVTLCASSQDFEVSPVLLDFNAEPATSQTQVISIKNHSNKKTSYLISIADFIPSQSGDNTVFPPNTTKNSCANWITINPSFFEVAPGGDINLQITMMVPGEEYKTAWCMLLIQPTKEQTSWGIDKEVSAGVNVTGRIGVNIFQAPGSLQNQVMQVSNFKEITDGSTNKKFSASIENIGDRITSCSVFLMVSNLMTGEEKKYSPQKFSVFPKMIRNIELDLPENLEKGSYSVAALVDYGPKFPLAGAQLIIDVK